MQLVLVGKGLITARQAAWDGKPWHGELAAFRVPSCLTGRVWAVWLLFVASIAGMHCVQWMVALSSGHRERMVREW